MIPDFIDRNQIPHHPGIYIYRDNSGNILYVGKAIDLYHRVASYFSGTPDSLKTASLVDGIRSVETIVVESELEALILEANLIKKYKPAFNVRLMDDKDYLYIAVTKEDFPKVVTARKKDLKPIKKWYGPFPSSNTVRNTLKRLRRVFPWCSNPPKNGRFRTCFYYHLGLCPGPCVGKIDKKEYLQIINRFIKFMDGKKQILIDELTDEMAKSSSKMEFENAQITKKVIDGISYLTQSNRVANYLENRNFLEDERKLALIQLQKDLKLSEIPARIECYDISNFQGAQATGSMVVLTNGEIDKTQYRRFKIKITGKPNDVAMHKEMMKRRLKHTEWPYPDLILIDGGRGQVRGVQGVILDKSQTVKTIPIYGLAKRMEWLYPPEGEVTKLPKRSLSLRLLQKIRDESHRFAITYHRKLRKAEFKIYTR